MTSRPNSAVTIARRGPPAWALLLVITVIGAWLRFYNLGRTPAGLYEDEAYNGLDAAQVLHGWRPIYFPANNGREPFYIYLVAAAVNGLGRSPLAVRLPAAVVGLLLIPATFVLGSGLFGRRAGLLAAAIVAITFWPLALSRIGLRAGALPLFTALSLGSAAWGWRLPAENPWRMRLLALGGALYGLTFYTYLAARFTPLPLFAFLILWYIARRSTFPHPRHLAAFGLPAVVMVLPLAVAAIWQPEIALGRAGQVSILNPAINHGDLWGTLFHNLLAAAGMFVWRGDDIARHNLPGRPVFDPLLGLHFLVGLWLLARRAWRGSLAAALVLIWTVSLLLPTVLAEDTPHFLRAVGVLPMICLIPAVAMATLWERAEAGVGAWRARWRRQTLPGMTAAALGVSVLVASLAWTVRDYFVVYANRPDTAYLFQSAATELATTSGAYLRGGGRRLFLDRRFWDSFAAVRFLLPAQPGLELYSEGEPLAPAAAPIRLVAWPYEALRPALGVLPPGSTISPGSGPLYRGDLEAEPYPLYAAYTAEPECPAALCAGPALAVFEGRFELLAAQPAPAAGGLTLELVWRAGGEAGAARQVFAQAWRSEAVIAQADGPLGTALYPSEWWRPGETVHETRQFIWAGAVDPAQVTIRVGLYDPLTNQRLKRIDSDQDYYLVAP